MRYDVIVIGGSYSGMAAALQLARARRSVLVIDGGARRNRFASHSHGFLGQDGADPGAIAASARRQLERYPSLSWRDAQAASVAGHVDAFTVTTADGQAHAGRRILMAIGVADQLPPVPGLAARWGKSVFHCPYCHGYELDQGAIGVIATGPMSAHQAQFLTEWGKVTLLTNGAPARDVGVNAAFENSPVRIEDAAIERIEGHADVRLADGRVRVFAGLFTAAPCIPNPLAEAAGCALEETPMGLQVQTGDDNKTSVPGIFACGDAARVPHSVSLAVGSGAMAGIHLHRSLVWPDSITAERGSQAR